LKKAAQCVPHLLLFGQQGNECRIGAPSQGFLHLAAGAAALPDVSRFAWAQAYPTLM